MKRILIVLACLLVCVLFGCSSDKTPYVPTGDGLSWEEDSQKDTTAPTQV